MLRRARQKRMWSATDRPSKATSATGDLVASQTASDPELDLVPMKNAAKYVSVPIMKAGRGVNQNDQLKGFNIFFPHGVRID